MKKGRSEVFDVVGDPGGAGAEVGVFKGGEVKLERAIDFVCYACGGKVTAGFVADRPVSLHDDPPCPEYHAETDTVGDLASYLERCRIGRQ